VKWSEDPSKKKSVGLNHILLTHINFFFKKKKNKKKKRKKKKQKTKNHILVIGDKFLFFLFLSISFIKNEKLTRNKKLKRGELLNNKPKSKKLSSAKSENNKQKICVYFFTLNKSKMS
jgi:hypothetical protein